ncbi:MAG: hypothetical protein ACT4RN_16835 [Pseudonocardia sp.]
MADLRMPDGMSESERHEWLKQLGRQLVEETGKPGGVTEQQHVPGGQPVWAVWWTEEPESRTSPDQRRHLAPDRRGDQVL